MDDGIVAMMTPEVDFGDYVAGPQVRVVEPLAASVPRNWHAGTLFLKQLDPTGWHHLDAFSPVTGYTAGQTFAPGAFDDMDAWIRERSGRLNLYFSVNEPRPGAPDAKLSKTDIGAIRAVFGDIDPRDGLPLDQERARLHEVADTLRAGACPPSAVIDSGGGIQPVWLLPEKLDPVEWISRAEALGRGVARELGGDAVQNIDRILRLPGTLNIPDAKKRAKGRAERRASIIATSDQRFTLPELEQHIEPVFVNEALDKSAEIAAVQQAIAGFDDAGTFEELDPDLKARFALALARRADLAALWRGNPAALLGDDTSGSAYRYALAVKLGELDYSAADFASLAFVWDWSVQNGDDRDAKLTLRSLARDWVNADAEAQFPTWCLEPPEPEPLFLDMPVAATAAGPEPIDWIDPALAWAETDPPERQWLVPGFVPEKEVTLLYGDGGIGKTLLMHQLAICAAAGMPWLGQTVKRSRVLLFLCEDGPDELHRRHADICRSLGVAIGEVWDLRIASRRQHENLLALFDRSTGAMKRQVVWEQLVTDAKAFRADVVIIDTLADVFAGNENDRAQVTAFAKNCLGRLGHEINGTVITLGHPSQSGKQSGDGSSGSTGWNNAVRSRLYLTRPKGSTSGDVRELEGKKANYGPQGNKIKIAWQRGAFVALAGSKPVASARQSFAEPVGADALATIEDAAERAALTAVAQLPAERMQLGASNSVYFAPRVIQRLRPNVVEAFSADEIEAALNRALAEGRVRISEVGRDGSRRPVHGLAVAVDKLSEPMELFE